MSMTVEQLRTFITANAIDMSQVTGSGANGNIVKKDLQQVVTQHLAQQPKPDSDLLATLTQLKNLGLLSQPHKSDKPSNAKYELSSQLGEAPNGAA